MPVRRSRQGSNSFAAKLITRANSAKVNNSVTTSNNQSSVTTINGGSGNFTNNKNNNNNNFNSGSSNSLLHTNGNIVNSKNGTSTNNGTSGIILTAKQQHQLQRNAYLSTLNKDQLKLECRKRGQKTSGTKLDLLQRLGYKMSLQQQVENSLINSKSNTYSSSNGSVPHQLNNSNHNNSSSSSKNRSNKDRERLRIERESLKIWSRPIDTFKYFVLECITLSKIYGKKLLEHKKCIAIFLLLATVVTVFYYIPGKHQAYFDTFRANAFFIMYWVGLGVLSSVGLGTGLHTFLLYLGPHIASVTLAAYECNSLDFPKPPYPDEIICPETIDPKFIPSLWNIMSKVRFEAFLWGAGTALGELPPYFMAKAARLSGIEPEDDEDLKEFEELQKKRATGESLTILDRGKLFMEQIVERVGFWGILACASIPNPLFDLAGITCGHFLVPFGTFFGATLIGKAVIKMHIQKIFVIIAFNEPLIERAVHVLGKVPMIGKKLQEPFKAFLADQMTKYHRRSDTKLPESRSKLAKMFEVFVVTMIVYFVASIINSFAQNYHKRIHKKPGKSHRKVARD